MNPWLIDHLVCPRDTSSLELTDKFLECSLGHRYPIYDDVPVLLVSDAEQTHPYADRTFESLISGDPARSADLIAPGSLIVDDFVQAEIPYTSGNLYIPVQHKLTRYPIPDLRLPEGGGHRLLDIGCNWGRWTVAAGRKGYKAVGIDPSLSAVLAARRVCRQFDVEADFVVGDARFLPFADDSFDTVFCYSVFQHFSKENTAISLRDAARVLKFGGRSLIQMANKYGIRQYQQRRRRGFTEGEGLDVRYWSPSELIRTFEKALGPTRISTDCYFGLGIQSSDLDILPIHHKAVVIASEIVRRMSLIFSPLTKVADSVYLESVNKKVASTVNERNSRHQH